MAALLGGEQGSRQSGGYLGDALRYNSRGISGPVERLADGRKDRAVVMGRAHTMALALLGAWLGLTLLMWFVAAGSFSTVDRVLRAPSPPLSEAAERIGHERTRMVLRYLASEINRNCFNVYGWGQVVLGALLLALLFRQFPRDGAALVIAGVMLGLVLLMTLVITPAIVALGRSIDFLPRNPPPAEIPRFRMLHMAFTGLDGIKFLTGVALLIRWVVAH